MEVTRKALSPLKTMYDKLMGLTFVEPRVSPIANLIDTALNYIPAKGPITGATQPTSWSMGRKFWTEKMRATSFRR